jgi:hypothetical protein
MLCSQRTDGLRTVMDDIERLCVTDMTAEEGTHVRRAAQATAALSNGELLTDETSNRGTRGCPSARA